MCNCIHEHEIKLMEEINKHEQYKGLQVENVRCDLTGWGIGEKVIYETILIPFTINHQLYKRKTKTKVTISATYCPLCGEKLNKEE